MKRNGSDKLNWLKRPFAVAALCAAATVALPAQTFTKLFNFDTTNGYEPIAGLVQGADGDFYGTTPYGGANPQTSCSGCAGTVFKINPNGTLTTLYNFCSQSGCADGEGPYAGLVQGTDGNFYGTTEGGGATAAGGISGGGTVFKITPDGTLTTLYKFCSQSGCTDGSIPMTALVLAANGDFYGTTAGGGADLSGAPNGGGTVFKITPDGALTTLYSFCSRSGCTDGTDPHGLVLAANGDFYGTTGGGGANGNHGTVFKINASGALTTLYSFCSLSDCTDGDSPYAGLVQATNGDFYGTTYSGGATNNGTVFKIAPSGTLTTLYSFCTEGVYPECPDGAWPNAALVQASDGRFYGTTPTGGANQVYGTAFRISLTGAFTTLHSFCSRFECADGASPQAGVVQGTNGDFYGTTLGGGGLGLYGDGTVFNLSTGLGPLVKTEPHFGAVGAAITILGTDLAGATGVSFNGTPTVFEVVSATEITTTVPVGATTGSVQVTTPGGVLLSGGPFLVAP